MHWIFLTIVILSLRGESASTTDDRLLNRGGDGGGDDIDDGLLQCYSCSTLLGDRHCSSFDNLEKELLLDMAIKCNEQEDEVLPHCVFKKDNEFAREAGLDDEPESSVNMMIFEPCPSGSDCSELPLISRSVLRNLVRGPGGSLLQEPAGSATSHSIPRDGGSSYGSYKTTHCFKLDALGMDGRHFTIRGCATNIIDGCLTGNYIDTEEYECYLCHENLCNGGCTLLLNSGLIVMIYFQAIRSVLI